MSIVLFQRPERIITGDEVSIYTGASSPTIYKFQRQDSQAEVDAPAVVESGSQPGFIAFRAEGDQTLLYSTGDVVYIRTDDGIYDGSGTITASPSYNVGANRTTIQINIIYTVDSGIGGFINNVTLLTNWRVRINIYDFSSDAQLISSIDYRDDPRGIVITDISGALSAILDNDNPFQGDQFIPVNRTQPGFSLKYYIDYQELYDGSVTAAVSDKNNPQVAVHAALGVNRSGSPNMLDFVGIDGTYIERGPFSNPQFIAAITPFINVTRGGGSVNWVWEDLTISEPDSRGLGGVRAMDGANGSSSILAQSGNDPIEESAFYAQTDYNLYLRIKNFDADVMQLNFWDKDLGLADTEANYLQARIFDARTGAELLSPIEVAGSLTADWIEVSLVYRPTRDVKNFGVSVDNKTGTTIDFLIDVFAVINPLALWLTRFDRVKKWRNEAASISFIYSNLMESADVPGAAELYITQNKEVSEEFFNNLDTTQEELVNQLNYREDGNPSEVIPSNVTTIEKRVGRIVPDWFDNPTFIVPNDTWDLDVGPGKDWTEGSGPGIPEIRIQLDPGEQSKGVAANPTGTNTKDWDFNRSFVFDIDYTVTGLAEIEIIAVFDATELLPGPNPFDKTYTYTGAEEIEVLSRHRVGVAGALTPTISSLKISVNNQLFANRIGIRARGIAGNGLTGEVFVEIDRFQATNINNYLVPMFADVQDQCINPFYLTWDNQFGGLDYYMFELNWTLRSNVRVGQRKFWVNQLEAPRIRLDEWLALDVLNHPGAIIRENLIDIELGKLDRTDRKLGQNVYLQEVINLIRGGGRRLGVIVIPTRNEIDIQNTTDGPGLTFRLQVQLPEQFTNTL